MRLSKQLRKRRKEAILLERFVLPNSFMLPFLELSFFTISLLD